jgi:type II secretory pathway component GspD/PulD (secretin)
MPLTPRSAYFPVRGKLVHLRVVVLACIIALFVPGVFPTLAAAQHAPAVVAQGQPLRSVLVSLSKRFRANIVAGSDVSGTVTVSLHDVTLDQALHAILAPLHAHFVKRDGTYIVLHDAPQIVSHWAPPPPAPSPTPALQPIVLNVTMIPVERAASVLRSLYPRASIHVDHASSALIVIATPDDVNGMRAVLQGVDVRNPTAPIVSAVQVQNTDPEALANRLRPLYPNAQITLAQRHGLLIRATPQDMDQIKQLISTVDQPPTPPSPPPASNADAVHITQARPQDVARTVASEFPHVRAAVAGSTVVLSGDPDEVTRAKALIAQIDLPPVGSRFLEVYRLNDVDASSVADLLTRSFPDAQITVDKDLNAISVFGSTGEQARISDAISQLDAPQSSAGQPGASAGLSGSNLEVVTLKSAIPSQSSSSTGPDPTQAIVQTLQQLVPNVKVTQLATPGQLALIGDPYSLRQANDALVKLDIPAPLVVLDTEILQIDESAATTLGLQGPTSLSATYTEIAPPAESNGAAQPIGDFLPLTRSLLTLPAQINLAIEHGSGRVLSDPRLTTLSGHTASIRAGDQISILTTTSGGVGTVNTSQLQTFQTGVTLDITPLVTSDSTVTVTLHPVVNSVDGANNGVPQISTREATTTVSLNDNQTLVIGGLIQDNNTRTETRIPVLGNLPLVGPLFRNNSITTDHNELVIVVTPHIVHPGETLPPPPMLPSPQPLPTIPPGAALPPLQSLPRPTRRHGADAALNQSLTAGTPATTLTAQGAPTPSPLPSGQVFTYGALPSTNYAKPGDPVKIYQATVSPTTVQNGTPLKVNVVSSTNTNQVTVAYGTQSTSLGQVGPGMWQGVLSFSTAAVAAGQSNLVMQITATRLDGSSTQIPVPITIGQ